MDNLTPNTLSKTFIWRQRIGFGISDYACNLAYLMVNTYLLIFYTDVAGLDPKAVSIMFVATKFFDAFTDYMVGALIDRTNTRMGRNRPWMLAGAPILAVGMVLVFTTPDFGPTGKLVWAYATYILFSFGYTMVNIPMGSMLPTLSADPTERTKIVTSRTVFSNLGSLTSASMALFLVSRLGNGNEALGYRNANIVFGIIVIIILLICVASVREINPAPPMEKSSIVKDIRFLVNNKPYMLILAYTICLFVGYLGMYASIAYYFKYIIGNEMLTSVAVSILTISPIISMFLSAMMNQRFSKRNISVFGAFVQIAGYVLMFAGKSSMAAIYAGVFFVGFGLGFRQNMFFSMLADTVDYGEWKNKKNLAGTQTAVSGFANKVASALATSIVGALLARGGYDGAAAVQSASANTAITVAFIWVPIICNALSIIVLLFYDLDKTYPQIKKEIDERRAGTVNEAKLQ